MVNNFKAMRLDIKGKQFIYNEEGLRLQAYLCPAGVWTIGYGNTYMLDNSRVKQGDKITLEQAQNLFDKKISYYEGSVNTGVKIALNQSQFNALTSFCYNIGSAGFLSSTLLKKVNSKAPLSDIEKEFNKWVHANKKVIRVLIDRRKREFKLFINNGN